MPAAGALVTRLATSRFVLWLQRGSVVMYSLGLLWFYGSRVNPDFAVFHGAAVRFLNGAEVYGPLVGGMPYVNGPGLSLLLVPLAPLGTTAAMGVWVGVSLALLFVLAGVLGHGTRGLWWLLAGVLVVSFAVRATLGNGQVGIVVAACVVGAATLIVAKRDHWVAGVLAGVLLYIGVELKPYLLVLPLLVLLLARRFVPLATVVVLVVLLNALLFTLNSGSTWWAWLESLINRASTINAESDQSSLLGVFTLNLGVPTWLALVLQVVVAVVLVVLTLRVQLPYHDRRGWTAKAAAVMALIPLISPYAHHQDWIFSVLALVILMVATGSEFFRSPLAWLALACLMAWGQQAPLAGVVTIGLFAVSLLLLRAPARALVAVVMLSLVVQGSQWIAYDLGGWQAQYRLTSVISLILGVLTWLVAFQALRTGGGVAGAHDTRLPQGKSQQDPAGE